MTAVLVPHFKDSSVLLQTRHKNNVLLPPLLLLYHHHHHYCCCYYYYYYPERLLASFFVLCNKHWALFVPESYRKPQREADRLLVVFIRVHGLVLRRRVRLMMMVMIRQLNQNAIAPLLMMYQLQFSLLAWKAV